VILNFNRKSTSCLELSFFYLSCAFCELTFEVELCGLDAL